MSGASGAACLPSTAQPVPAGQSKRCIAQGAWGQHLLKGLIQVSWPSSLKHRYSWRSRWDPCGPIPLQLWATIYSFLATPAQWWRHLCAPCYSLSSYSLQLRLLHPAISRVIVWLGSGTLILIYSLSPCEENKSDAGEGRERMALEEQVWLRKDTNQQFKRYKKP